MKENSLKMLEPKLPQSSWVKETTEELRSIFDKGPFFLKKGALFIMTSSNVGMHELSRPGIKPHFADPKKFLNKEIIPVSTEIASCYFVKEFIRQGKGESFQGFPTARFQHFILAYSPQEGVCFSGAIVQNTGTKRMVLYSESKWLDPDIAIESSLKVHSAGGVAIQSNIFKINASQLDDYLADRKELISKYSF